MWLSKRRLIVAMVVTATLTACGYTPAFRSSGPATSLQSQVTMQIPDNRNEFDLVTQLEQRLGHSGSPIYQLSYEVETKKTGVGVTPGQEIIRINIFGKAAYTLTDITTGAVLTRGSADTFTGYSVGAVDAAALPPSTNATISTLAAERDANARLMVILADQIVTRLIATSSDWSR